jgi:hypothetical protein
MSRPRQAYCRPHHSRQQHPNSSVVGASETNVEQTSVTNNAALLGKCAQFGAHSRMDGWQGRESGRHGPAQKTKVAPMTTTRRQQYERHTHDGTREGLHAFELLLCQASSTSSFPRPPALLPQPRAYLEGQCALLNACPSATAPDGRAGLIDARFASSA